VKDLCRLAGRDPAFGFEIKSTRQPAVSDHEFAPQPEGL
jgi:hypothetical protein